jgi:hypothetical protein
MRLDKLGNSLKRLDTRFVVYSPIKVMAAPQANTDAPATACAYRPVVGSLSFSSPIVVAATQASMVKTVITLKTIATTAINAVLCCAAGYMNSGINASHGPSTKIMNIAQGVIERFEATS